MAKLTRRYRQNSRGAIAKFTRRYRQIILALSTNARGVFANDSRGYPQIHATFSPRYMFTRRCRQITAS